MAYRLRTQDPQAALALGDACDLGVTTAQVLLNRGLGDARDAGEFLAARLSGLTPPDAMADRGLAADRLARAAQAGERVVVFGDYDADGTTSAAILADVLEALGADVEALGANRFDGGYGFSDAALLRCLDAGARLIVTCDCGSSDHERIAEAARAGVDVIVVDHHLVPEEPLPALAFINPHRPDCGFSYKGLASAGLALSLGAALRRAVGAELDMRAWLDLVALGTIADLAPLDGDNRRLVRAGLQRLSSRSVRPGIAALRATSHSRGRLGAMDVSFGLAPRLNAPGRLSDAGLTLALLRARSAQEARTLAERVEALNVERKRIEREVTAQAIADLVARRGEHPAGAVVVASQGWHRGVVGISAARLVDRFGVPAVVVSLEGGVGHGSARAPAGFRLYDAIERCAAELSTFGGHQSAAGLSLRAQRVEAFRAAFVDVCAAQGARRAPEPPSVDALIDGSSYPLPSAQDLWRLEPLGRGNDEPLFAVEGARLERVKPVGGGSHLQMTLRIGGRPVRAFGYGLGHLTGALGAEVDLLGHVRIDTYRGGGAVELRVTSMSGSA